MKCNENGLGFGTLLGLVLGMKLVLVLGLGLGFRAVV